MHNLEIRLVLYCWDFTCCGHEPWLGLATSGILFPF